MMSKSMGVVRRWMERLVCALRWLGVVSFVLVVATQFGFAQGRPDIVWIQKGTREVNSVAFSPDGRLLASGSLDRTIRLWQVSDGQPLRTLAGHTDWVTSVAFSPNGQLLASGSGDGTIRLWQVADGQLLRILAGHIRPVESVAFSPDGQRIASGSRDGTIRLWQVSDGQPLRTYDEETGIGVLSVQFSPSGQFFAYGCIDGTVVLARNPFWIPGDVDGNGCVNDADLLRVLSAFGCPSNCGTEDVNGDGAVNDADLLVVLFNFGIEC